MNCVMIIACLVVGFLLGRMNSVDGVLIIGENPEEFTINFNFEKRVLPRCKYIFLKVMEEGAEG